MSLDTFDQETVDSLPRLPDVYDAYGVQVNALSVSEIFALYEHTGFLYPEKAARLFPHLGQVRENWRRMLDAGESLLYVLTAGDKKRGRASLAVWRTTHHGWMSQHLVCENNPYASRAVMLAAAAGAIRKGSDLSAQNWFRPENRFPARADHWRAALVSAATCIFCITEKAIAAHGKANSRRALQSIAQTSSFGNRFGRARKHLCHGGRATAGRRI